MKIAKLGLLALLPVMMTGCVVDETPPYSSGYYGSDTYYVDSYGHRHYRHHHRYQGNGGYVGGGTSANGGSGGYSGGGTPANGGSGRYSGAGTPVNGGGGYSGGSANPSRPSGFGRSGRVSPVPTPENAPHNGGGYSGGAANPAPTPAPQKKIILNKPNPSLPQGPSSTHVLKPENKQGGSDGFSGGGTPAQ
jgi:hypothetical protein